MKTSLREKFEARVQKTEGCWFWIGTRLPHGYGTVGVKGRGNLYGHRLSWELHYGKIPDNLFVLHRCDVRHCVNPEHLFLGTQKDNIKDCATKGRFASPDRTRRVGEANGRAKITREQALEIRRRYLEAPRQRQQIQCGKLLAIAKDYGLTAQMVRYIGKGIHWK